MAAGDYDGDVGGVDDVLYEVACRGGFHRSKEVFKVRRFLSVLVPKVKKKISFGGECSAGHEEMLNVARDVFARTEETVPLLICQGPVSTMPVRPVTATHHSSDSNRLVHFIWVVQASGPEWMWLEEAHVLRLEVLQ